MKKTLLTVTIAVLTLTVASAAQTSLPAVQDNGVTSSAGGNENTKVVVKAKPNLGSAPTFQNFFSFGPPQNAASYAGYTANAVSQLEFSGMLTGGSGPRTSPTDVRAINTVLPEYLMTTASAPFYWDSFSPASPWDNERGGTIWAWEEVIAASGQTIALADISGTISSSDSGDVLGKTYSLTPNSYSPTAIGVNLDGSQVTSGPATQTVTGRIIFGVGFKSFNVTTSNDVTAVKNFIYQFQRFSITNTITADGGSAKFVISTMPPSLMARKAGNQMEVVATPSDDPKSYALQYSLNINGVWNPAGFIRAGQTNDFGFQYPTFFVRYAP